MLRRKRSADSEPPPGEVDPVLERPAPGPAVDPTRAWELVAVDPESGRHVDIGLRVTFRDLEILGSAGRFYGERYTNAERPEVQVEWRRERALAVGDALWEAATDRVGIQPSD